MKDIKAILGLVMIKAVLFEFFHERISCFDIKLLVNIGKKNLFHNK